MEQCCTMSKSRFTSLFFSWSLERTRNGAICVFWPLNTNLSREIWETQPSVSDLLLEVREPGLGRLNNVKCAQHHFHTICFSLRWCSQMNALFFFVFFGLLFFFWFSFHGFQMHIFDIYLINSVWFSYLWPSILLFPGWCMWEMVSPSAHRNYTLHTLIILATNKLKLVNVIVCWTYSAYNLCTSICEMLGKRCQFHAVDGT